MLIRPLGSLLIMFDIFVVAVGVIMGISPILQIVRIVHRRHSDDVSLTMFAVITFGACTWLAYGFEHHLPTVIIANIAGAVANLATILVALRYRHSAR
jgi:MtN3 and saliva related transmembrane protein